MSNRLRILLYSASNCCCMVSYNSTLCDRWVDEDYGKFLGELNSSSHAVREAEQPPVTSSIVWGVLMKPLLTWWY